MQSEFLLSKGKVWSIILLWEMIQITVKMSHVSNCQRCLHYQVGDTITILTVTIWLPCFHIYFLIFHNVFFFLSFFFKTLNDFDISNVIFFWFLSTENQISTVENEKLKFLQALKNYKTGSVSSKASIFVQYPIIQMRFLLALTAKEPSTPSIK